MVSVCFYFQVHRANELSNYSVLDIGNKNGYFSTEKTEQAVKKSEKLYNLTNKKLLCNLNQNRELKLSFSISGTAIEQFQEYSPNVVEGFSKLIDTGQVELLSETFYHSLSSVFSKSEFATQIDLHNKIIKNTFGIRPRSFRNTELIYNNELAKVVEDLGYSSILADGADQILGWRSPNYIYSPETSSSIKLFLKNYKLSDDIEKRMNTKSWNEYPLSPKKYASWISSINGNGNVVNLFMDFDAICNSTTTMNFIEKLPNEILKHNDNQFMTITEASQEYESVAKLDIHNLISWKDSKKDLGPWMKNNLQKSALNKLFNLEKNVLGSGDEGLITDWRNLQVSNYFHNMSHTENKSYDAFINYMNIINDLTRRVNTI